ncbi:MAG TPA: hypothetical protein VGX00_08340 [Thermoplasmata archaeon]|nr:hypothetical protein [Thermoplasmata archaeon]
MPRRPFLYSLARSFGLLSVLAVVIVAIFIVLAVYSAAQLRPGPGAGPTGSFAPGPGNTVLLRTNVSIVNPGYFALSDLTVHLIVRLPGPGGAVVAQGASPPVSIPNGGQGEVPIELSVPIAASVDAPLLTHDMVLPESTWVNATYAQVFAIALTLPRNVSWGAPFANLSVTEGNPRLLGNGTTEASFNLSFSDDAGFPIAGAIHYAITNSSDAQCTSGSLPISVGAHSPFRGGTTLFVSPACRPPGDRLSVEFDGGSWNVPLVQEAFG